MLEKYSRAGRDADVPFRICAIISAKSFGDYASVLLFITNVAAQFEHSEVTFIYKEDTDYKTPLLRTANFARKFAFPVDYRLPSMEFFAGNVTPELKEQEVDFAALMSASDFFITDAMASVPLLCSFSPLHHLRFAQDDVERLTAELAARGLAIDHWFCALHHREPGYQYKPEGLNFRDTNPEPYLQFRDFVIEKLGGQVVRLGHPTMTPFPPRDGFVDLSRESNSALLQAFAVSRARYFVATASGPVALGHTFGTPTGRVNSVDYWQASELDLIRTVDVVMPNGEVLRQNALYERGIDKHFMGMGLRDGTVRSVIQNDFPDLCKIAEALHRETSQVIGWRTEAARPPYVAPNVLMWPRQPIKRARFLPV